MASQANKPRIAIVDDDELIVNTFATQFSDEFEILRITEPTEALDVIDDLVMVAVVDEKMHSIAGTEILSLLKERRPLITRILLTAHASLECLSKAINEAEVRHFIDKRRATAKDWDRYMRNILRDAVALCRASYREEAHKSLRHSVICNGFDKLIGGGAALSEVLATARGIAKVDTIPVLIQGETGTGKELLARAIHYEGVRRAGVFLPLNCATFERELIGSELFGHVKGAFTGAHADKKGCLELADSGTVFFDEIGDMPLDVQAHLNRFLDQGEFRRIGDSAVQARHSDVRVIAATHLDLGSAIRQNRFRQDLYFRLSKCVLVLPPLRQRVEDIPELATNLLSAACLKQHKPVPRLAGSVLDALTQHSFPGNIRELQGLIELALALAEDDVEQLELRHFNFRIPPVTESRAGSLDASLREMQDAFDRDKIQERLRHFGGHRGRTAESLKITPRWLNTRMQQLNIRWPET